MGFVDVYIESIPNKNTAKVAKKYLKNAPEGFEDFSLSELNSYILSLRPTGEHDISNICSRIKAYAKWLDENNILRNNLLLQNVPRIDKKQLWEQAKQETEGKFLSYEQYQSVISRIRVEEGYNPLYYEALFRSIYEGIYSDDLSVLKNLRRSDINGNVITLHDDNNATYQLKVSEELAHQLEKLSNINIWYRPNKHGVCEVDLVGIFHDSVFMSEKRKNQSPKAPRFSYYDKLRDIQENYVGYTLSPKNIYISGIVHRLKWLLDNHNITLREAFAGNNRNELVRTIVINELNRCNGIIQIENFRELIKGHIDVFESDSTEDIDKNLFNVIIPHEQPDEYLEGAEYLSKHLSHERNVEIVALAKEEFKANHFGRLYCEKCGFDFSEKYGERGNDFIEVHHIKAISKRKRNEQTKVEDLVMLCSNCHSIVHRKQPWLSMSELEEILSKH